QQPGLAQDLEAVADPNDGATALGELPHRPHDPGEPRDGAGSQVVAVGEPAGQDHGVHVGKRGVPVPDRNALAVQEANSPEGVATATNRYCTGLPYDEGTGRTARPSAGRRPPGTGPRCSVPPHLGGREGAARGSSPTRPASPERTACRTTAADRPARSGRRARTVTSPGSA